MAAKKRKPSKYHKILKQFTKINDKLPEDRKVSIKLRREIIRKELLPKYEDVPYYKIRVKALKKLIVNRVDKIPPKEICDLNYIDPSNYAYIEFFSLDETIRELVPDCIYVKVSAGEYGETNVFNTRNYEYGRKGVREIVENIRPDAEDQSGEYIFTGIQKLRKGKTNNGIPENYYLDFVLIHISPAGVELPYGDTNRVKYNLPKTREVGKKKTRIRKVIEQRIKKLKSIKDSKKRAKKTLAKNISQLTATMKRLNKAKKPSDHLRATGRNQFIKSTDLLEKYLKNGKITQKQYDSSLQKILKNFYDDEENSK